MRLVTLALAALLLAAPAGAGPRPCGDDVDGHGRRVPCACGDVLVGSHALGPEDPVTQQVCDGTGLLVDVPAGHPAATLGLGGQTLAGSGHGIGIQVVGGGIAPGLTIVGPGTVSGFDTGILAPHGLAAVREVLATDNASDGFSLGGSAYEVRACEAVRNGRDGFALRGRAPRLDGNRALQNHRHGFRIAGREAEVGSQIGNEGSGNGREGLRVRGRGHVLTAPAATANGAAGIHARVSHGRITGAVVNANTGDGLRAAGTGLTVTGSGADDNGGDGIWVRGKRVTDGGGNHAGRNRIRRSDRAAGRAECRVGASCR